MLVLAVAGVFVIDLRVEFYDGEGLNNIGVELDENKKGIPFIRRSLV